MCFDLLNYLTGQVVKENTEKQFEELPLEVVHDGKFYYYKEQL